LRIWFRTASFLVICCSFLLSCGKEGPPKPRLYDLPAPVTIEALQVGLEARITISSHGKRLSGNHINRPYHIQIYLLTLPLKDARLPQSPPLEGVVNSNNLVSEMMIDPAELKSPDSAITTVISLKEYLEKSSFNGFFLSAMVKDGAGKISSPSPVYGFLVSTPPSPLPEARARSVSKGVNLSWDRGDCSAVAVKLHEPADRILGVFMENDYFIHSEVNHDTRYKYGFYCNAGIEGVFSEPFFVDHLHLDTFPPPPVSDLVLVRLKDSLRLTWKSGGDTSLYRLWVKCGEGDPELKAETTKLFLEFPHSNCRPGISAVDSVGNESEIVFVKEGKDGN